MTHACNSYKANVMALQPPIEYTYLLIEYYSYKLNKSVSAVFAPQFSCLYKMPS